MLRKKALFFPFLLVMLAVPAFGDHDPETTVGTSPSWDPGLTYLGTFSGVDSDALISMIVGEDVTQIGKVEDPFDPNNGLSITCTGGCASASGTWSYTGSATVAYLVLKAGDFFAVYRIDSGGTMDRSWETGDLPHGGSEPIEISHISIYSVVPEPASIFLLGTALLGLGFLRRKL